MLNLLPKSMIINNIVDTLKKDPENGVVKLLETAKSHTKTIDEQAMLGQVIAYYSTSATAKMQVRNLVYNTSKKTLYSFAEKVYDCLSRQPIVLDFMRLITIDQAAELRVDAPIFPVIDLKNANVATTDVLSRLKNNGMIFFASIAVTEENFDIVTSDEVILTLVKYGIRAIFYRMPATNTPLEARLLKKIHQIRTQRPILAFFMKKDVPNSTSLVYVMSENVNGKAYEVRLRL